MSHTIAVLLDRVDSNGVFTRESVPTTGENVESTIARYADDATAHGGHMVRAQVLTATALPGWSTSGVNRSPRTVDEVNAQNVCEMIGHNSAYCLTCRPLLHELVALHTA